MSFKDMALVPGDILQERLEPVKELSREETELYEIVRDRKTGEHYIHYAYLHLRVAEGGVEESFHQLLPVDNDDVLAIVLGEQRYTYPEMWTKSFLRNGPDKQYVWFDPSPIAEGGSEDNEAIARELERKLNEFKQKGKFDEQSVKKLLSEMDRIGE